MLENHTERERKKNLIIRNLNKALSICSFILRLPTWLHRLALGWGQEYLTLSFSRVQSHGILIFLYHNDRLEGPAWPATVLKTSGDSLRQMAHRLQGPLCCLSVFALPHTVVPTLSITPKYISLNLGWPDTPFVSHRTDGFRGCRCCNHLCPPIPAILQQVRFPQPLGSTQCWKARAKSLVLFLPQDIVNKSLLAKWMHFLSLNKGGNLELLMCILPRNFADAVSAIFPIITRWC